MPAPLTTTFLGFGAVLTAISPLAGAIVAGIAVISEAAVALATPPE